MANITVQHLIVTPVALVLHLNKYYFNKYQTLEKVYYFKHSSSEKKYFKK